MSLFRKLRRKVERENHTRFTLEPLEPRLLLNADLTVDMFENDTPGPYTWGDSLDLAADVINIGDTDAGSFDVTIALSQDMAWDGPGTDTVLDTFPIASLPFDSTGDANLSINDRMVDLPSDGVDGDYNLFMIIDDANAVTEDNETNNFASLVVHIDAGSPPPDPNPDLTITNFQAGSPVVLGQPFDVTNEVYNPSANSAGGFLVDIVLSPDSTIDLSDMVLTNRSITSLDAGIYDEAHTMVTIPDDDSVTPGQYYLGMIVDPTAQVSETDENNNTVGFAIQVDAPTANIDLEPTSLTWPGGTEFTSGGAVDITTNVKNFGADPVAGFTMQIVFSDDPGFATQEVLAEWTMSSLAAGAEDMQVHNITIPSSLADGEYYLAVKADALNDVDEFEETNNKISTPIMIGSSGPSGDIELQPDDFMVNTPPPVNWSDTISIAADVRNAGDTDAGPFDVTIYLSQDDQLDGGDTVLHTFTITSLAGAGAVSANDVNVTMPGSGTDGDYYLVMEVDSGKVIDEPNETDNVVSVPFYVGPGSPSGDPELQVDHFQLNETPPLIWGDTLNVDANVRNAGDLDASSFNVSIYLSQDNAIDGGDTILDSFTITSLAGADTVSSNNIDVTLPGSGTDGDYYLIMEVDSAHVIDEPNEGDNVASLPINISQSGGPAAGVDLVADPPEFPANMEMVWGQEYTMALDAFNEGDTAAGAFTLSMFFSTDNTYDVGDTLLAEVQVSSLAAQSDSINDVNATLPAAGTYSDGDYYLIVFADSAEIIEETDEANNIAFQQISFVTTANLTPGIDLEVLEFDLDTMPPLQWGQTYDGAADIKNSGDTDAGSFTVSLALSDDAVFDPSDTVVHSFDIASLASGTPSFNDITFTLPAEGTLSDGDYHLLMAIDSAAAVSEANEDNNTSEIMVNIGSGGTPGNEVELITQNFNLPGTDPLNWGATLQVEADVQNTGDADAGPFDVTIYLSQDDMLDGGDTVLHSFTVNSLASGVTQPNTFDITLPASGTDGDYYLFMEVDSAHVIDEPNEQDNTGQIPVYIGEGGPGGQAELQVDDFLLNSTPPNQWGATINLGANVRNAGSVDAGAFDVSIYLSQDNLLDGGDTVLHSFTISSLAGSDTISSNNIDVTLPGSGTDGEYHLIMEVDSAHVIDEPSEEDNVSAMPIYIGESGDPGPGPEPVAGIDLVSTPPEFPTNLDMVWGQTYPLWLDAFNQGDTDAGPFTITLAFSADATFDAGDTVLADLDITSLASMTGSDNDVNVTLPAEGTVPDGTYNLIVIVDSAGTVDEADESNNIVYQALNFTSSANLEPGIDLQVLEFHLDVMDPPAQWGQTYEAAADIYNSGDTAAGAFTVTIALSSDATFDPSDTVVHTFDVASLAAGAMSINDVMVTLPAEGTLPDGEYNIVMAVDSANAVDESDETNNTDDMMMYVGQGGEPGGQTELIAQNFNLPGTDPINWGATLQVEADVQNTGDTDAGAFDVTIYLSQDDMLDGGDTALHSFTVSSLASGVTQPNTFDITLPASGTDGDYYLFMEVDSGHVIDEPNEQDNTWQMPIYIGEGGPGSEPELQIDNFLVNTDPPIQWGATVNLDADVRNAGPVEAGSFDVSIYLSQDNLLDGGDTVLHSFTVSSLAGADTISSNNIDITLPASGTDGEYHLIMEVDSSHVIAEPSEEDNVTAMPFYIGAGGGPGPEPVAGIDLTTHPLDIPAELDFVWGQTYPMPLDVFNQGDTDAGPFTITLVLSSDATFDAGDTVLADLDITSLASMADSGNDVNVTLPAEGTLPDGTYNIMVVIDSAGTVDEADETNNTVYQALNFTSSANLEPGIDLQVLEFHLDVMDPPAQWGQTYEAAADIYNAGDTAAGAFTVTIALSSDATFDPSDTVVHTFDIASLAAGAMSINDVMVTLPAEGTLPDGEYNIVMAVDTASTVDESDETNNTQVMPMYVGQGGEPGGQTELIAQNFNLPGTDPINWGSTLQVEADVQNTGDTDAGPFDVTIYLSADDMLDGGDTVLNSFTVSSLAAGATQPNNFGISLPASGTDGDYYLFMEVDSGHVIDEPNEQDNTWQMPIYIGEGGGPGPGPEPVAGIDLTTHPLEIPAELDFIWGQTYPMPLDVFNQGDTDAGPFTITLAFSTDATFDAGDTVLADMDITSLASMTGSGNDVNITLPAEGTLPDGTYNIIVVIDSANTVTEADETNNIVYQALNFTSASNLEPGTDLQVLEFHLNVMDPPAQWGQTYEAAADVYNAGDTAANAFTITIALSSDAAYDQSDTVLGTLDITSLSAGGVSINDVMITFPAEGTLPDGDYNIIMVVDSAAAIDETDETNNSEVKMRYIGQGGEPTSDAELQVSQLSIQNTGAVVWGGTLELQAGISNWGNADASSFDVDIVLSQDGQLDPGDISLYTFNIGSLASGQTWTEPLSVTLPAEGTNGNYQVIMYVDSQDVIPEPSEQDNFWYMPLFIGSGGAADGVDLKPDEESNESPPFDLIWGNSYEMPVDVFNEGNGNAGPFTITVVFSADDVYDAADELLGTIAVPGLGPWQDSINDLPVTLPQAGTLPDGTYYAIIIVDSSDAVAEINEDNNVAVMPLPIFTTPNLTEGVELKIIDFDDDVEGNFEWSQSYSVVVDLFNAGDTDAGPFDVTIALSDDYNFDATDEVVGTMQISGIASGAMLANDVTITLPDGAERPDGLYYLVLSVDSANVIPETNEDDNFDDMDIFIGAGVADPTSQIDLQVYSVMVPPPPLFWGGFLGLDVNISNNQGGTVDQPFDLSLYVSEDGNFDGTGEYLIGEMTIYAMQGWDNFNVFIDAHFPPEDTFTNDNLFLGAFIDSQNVVEESNENNNVFVTNIFLETPVMAQGVDLAVPYVNAPMMVSAAQTIDVGFGVENWGDTTSDPFTMSFFLSSDPMIDVDEQGNLGPDEVLLGEVSMDALASNAFTESMTTLTLPEELSYDFYHLVAVANFDKSAEEAFYDNNFAIAFFNIMASGNDLAIFDMNMPYDAQWGQVISVDAFVHNLGAQTIDSVDVAFYLSEDWEFDPADTLLASTTLTDLPSGVQQMASAEITLPDDQDGDAMLQIIALVDPDNLIEENDEFNNTWTRDLYIGTPELPNLMAWPMIMFGPEPTPIDWGQSLTIETTIHNSSNATTSQPFMVSYYLSKDNTLSFDDTTLYSVEIDHDMMPFEHYNQTVDVPLPAESPDGNPQGEWHILAQADSSEVINEFDEMDNVDWVPIFIGLPPADLGGWFETDVEGEVIWGADVPLVGMIENFGGSDAGAFEVNYYLTGDPEIDPSDVLLATQSVTSLAAQSNTPVLSSVTLPTDPGTFGSGTVFIVAVVDAQNTVEEMDEYNNFMGDWLTTDVAAAELVPFFMAPYAPDTGDSGSTDQMYGGPMFWGQTINIDYALGNKGNMDAENFQVSFFLADHDAILQDAYLLGSETITSLTADQEYQTTTTLTLPDPSAVDFVDPTYIDGTYMLMMQIDSTEVVDEMVEQNNLFFIPIRLEVQHGMLEVTDSTTDPYDMMIEFGPILQGQAVAQTFTIANTGVGLLNINGINSDNPDYTISMGDTPVDPTATFALDPQQSLTFEVTFHAALQGYSQGQIHILSDDPGMSDAFLSVWADVVSAPVDLALDAITAPTSAHWGDSLNLSIRLKNLQSADATDCYLDIMLSDSSDPLQPGAMMMPLSGQPLALIAANSTTTQSVTVDLPETSPFGFGGQFYLHAVINPGGDSFDENFDNNEKYASLQITTEAVGKPDLTFSWLWLPPELQWGDDLDVSVGIRNMGMADAGAFDVNYYLSADDILDDSDLLINSAGTTTLPGLSALGEVEGHLQTTLPADGDGDIYHVIIQIDPDNAVQEDFEDNNLAIGRFAVGSESTIDLVAESIVAPAEVTIGNDMALNLQVANTSDEDATGVRVEFFLSDPANTDPYFLGQFLGSMWVDVPAQQSIDAEYHTILWDGDVTPGQQYYLKALVDSNQMYFEEDEDNNLITSLDPISVSGGDIDLAGTFTHAPAQADWDEMFTIDVTVSNTGNIPASPFFVDLFLSNNNVLDSEDFYLNSQMIFNLEPGQDNILPIDVFLPPSRPSGDGDYYLIANIDGGQVVLETNEDNNVITSTLAISGTPDLAIAWQDVPFNSNFDQTITVTDFVENWGNSDASSFDVEYYLSLDTIWDEQTDTLLGSRTISSLAAAGSNTASTDLTLPEEGEEGYYYLLAVADPADLIAESAEDELPDGQLQMNNLIAAPLEIITQGMPDLKPNAISLAETSDWGNSIVVQNTVANIGTADAGQFTVTFYLSDNASISSRDVVLGTRSVTALTSGNTNQSSTTLTLPEVNPFGEDGDFYIGMKVDSAGSVAETNEENNLLVSSTTMTIGDVVNVDLIAAFVMAPPGGVAGEPLDVFYEVYNAGSSASGSFDIDFYMTSQGVIDESSTLLGSTTISSLSAGIFESSSTQFTLPQALSGQSFTLAMQVNADQTVEEKTYENNIAIVRNPISVTEPVQTDLSVLSLSGDSAEATWGETLSLQYQLQASEDITGSVDLGFFMVPLDGPSPEQQIALTQVDLSASGVVSGTFDLTLPAASPFGRDGNFDVIAVIDPQNDIPESSEMNNFAQTQVNVGSGLADLVALNLSGVPTVSAGQSFDAFNELANYGSVDAAAFDVHFYLTTDKDGIDTTTDTYLGTRHVNSLSSGSANWSLKSLTIPASGLDDGEYYLAMMVDTYDDVDESLETNNIVFSEKPVKVRSVSVLPDEYEPNNTTGSATELTIDEEGFIDTVSASLHNNQDLDYFSFTTPSTADGSVRLMVTPSDTLNAALIVYNSSGTQIGGADTDPDFGGEEIYASFSLTPGREYTVLVKPIGESFGQYTLDMELGLGTVGDAYETNETTATAYYLGKASTSFDDANIHTGTDIDYYQFAVPAISTGQMTVSIDPDPTLDAILQLFNSSGTLVGSSDIGGADSTESITYTGTVGANYYAKVTAWAGSTGAYEFNLSFTDAQLPDSYESNNTLATASVPTKTTLTSPTIHNGDIDYYQFTVPEGSTQLEAYLIGSQGLDAALDLFDESGTLLRSVDRTGVNGSETLLIDGLESLQTLFISVDGINDTTGRYSLELTYGNEQVGDVAEPNNQVSTAFPLILNEGTLSFDGLSIHDDDDRDYFTFVAPADTDGTAFVTVWAADTATDLNVSIRLLDDDSATVKSTDATGAGENETLTVSSGLTAGETYYIDVNGWGTTGDYRLSVSTPLISASKAQEVPQPVYNNNIMTSSGYLLDGSEPEIVVVEEIAGVNDDDLSFGATPVGSSLSYYFSVLNTGGSALSISSAAITGTDAAVFEVTPATADVDPGSTQQFTVSFTPAAVQLYSNATLTLASNDTDESSYELALSGTGTVSTQKPDISVVDLDSTAITSLAFADTLVDDSTTASFLVLNEGSASLRVSSAVISGTDADAFSLLFTNLANKTSDDYTIAAAGQKLLQIDFEPTSTGAHSATLTLTSNDPDETTVTVALTGNGVEPNLVVDLTPSDGTVANPLNPTLTFDPVVNDGAGGESSLYPINIVNTGNTTLTISSIAFSNAAFSITGVDANGFTLAAGATASANVVFDPTITNTYSNTMTVSSDDPDTPSMQFTLSAQATQASNTSLSGGATYEFTDSDGDLIEVKFGRSGTAVLAFDGSVEAGANISSITITGSSLIGSLDINVKEATGNGLADVGAITIDSAFGTVEVEGSVESLTVDGGIRSVVTEGALGGFSAEGMISTFNTGGLSGTITAGMFLRMNIDGDLDQADISTDDSSFLSGLFFLTVDGSITDSSLDVGTIMQMTVTGDIDGLDVNVDGSNGQMGRTTITGDVTGLDATAPSFGGLNVTGNLLDSSFVANSSLMPRFGSLNVTGNADVDITVPGMIMGLDIGGNLAGQIASSGSMGRILGVSVDGDLTASLSSTNSIMTIEAGGSIDSDSILVQGTGRGMVLRLNSGSDMNINNFNVDGMLLGINVGSETNPGNLSGSLSADGMINQVKIYGDLLGDLTSSSRFGFVTINGDLGEDADIVSTAGNITKLTFGDTIYGNVTANNGTGTIMMIQRGTNAFVNPDTGISDSAGLHILADLARTLWQSL